jgi:Ca-activated chloride channel family protein
MVGRFKFIWRKGGQMNHFQNKTYFTANLFLSLFFLTSLSIYAQTWRRDLRKGNEYYNRKNFKEAESKYQESIKKNQSNFDAQFNLGDAYYKQKRFDEAIKKFSSLKEKTKDDNKLSQLYHNLGNSFLKAKKYEESIQAFKQSLKLLPKDTDTKYNLAYANAMLQKQKQQQKQKEKKKDTENKKDNKNNPNQDNNKKEKQSGDQDKNKINTKPNQMNKEQAEQLLKAMEGKEKDVQQKVNAQKVKGARIKVEKDW